MEMGIRSVFLCLYALAFILAGEGTLSAQDKWIGAWKLNPAETKVGNMSIPKSLILKFEAVPGGMKVISDAVHTQAPVHNEYTVTYDGKDTTPNPRTPANTLSAKRIDANTFDFFSKLNGIVIVTTRHVVSPNGKKLTATAKGGRFVTDLQGKRTRQDFTQVMVYDRQS